MNEKLFQLLGIDNASEMSEVVSAFESFRNDLEKKIAQAPTPALKTKLRKNLREMEASFERYTDDEAALHRQDKTVEEIPSTTRQNTTDESLGDSATHPVESSSSRSKLPFHFQGKKLLTAESVAKAFHSDYEAGYDEYISGNLAKWMKSQLLDPHYANVLTEIDADKNLKDNDQKFGLVLLLLDPTKPLMIEGVSFKNPKHITEASFEQLVHENQKSWQFEPSGLGKWKQKITGKPDLEKKTQAILDAFEPFDRLYFDGIFTKAELIDLCYNSPSGSKIAGLHWVAHTYDEIIDRFGWNVIDKAKAISLLEEGRETGSLGNRTQEAKELLESYASVSSPALKPLIGKTDMDDAEAIVVIAGEGWKTVQEVVQKKEKNEQARTLTLKWFVIISILVAISAAGWWQYTAHRTKQKNIRIAVGEMVLIPAGSFKMGHPEHFAKSVTDAAEFEYILETASPARVVSIDEFYMGKFEVTVRQWSLCEEAGHCRKIDRTNKNYQITFPKVTGNSPIHDIRKSDAEDFVKWLSHLTGDKYRLPSEAEWEYAVRAGTDTRFYWGDEIKMDKMLCFLCLSKKYLDRKKFLYINLGPLEVGMLEPNQFGLHDMYGSVSEWVADCAHFTYKGAPKNQRAWSRNCSKWDNENAELGIARGGSSFAFPKHLGSYYRFFWPLNNDDHTYKHIGIRLVREIQ